MNIDDSTKGFGTTRNSQKYSIFHQMAYLDLVSAVTYYKVSATSPKHKYIPFYEKYFVKNEFHSQLS